MHKVPAKISKSGFPFMWSLLNVWVTRIVSYALRFMLCKPRRDSNVYGFASNVGGFASNVDGFASNVGGFASNVYGFASFVEKQTSDVIELFSSTRDWYMQSIGEYSRLLLAYPPTFFICYVIVALFIQKLLGHNDIKTTLKYLHVNQ